MTKILSSEQLKQLSREKSIRGVVVRLAQKRAEEAGPEQQKTLEEALQLLLDKFQSETGDEK